MEERYRCEVRSDPLPPTREQGEDFSHKIQNTKNRTQNTENDKHWQSKIAQKMKYKISETLPVFLEHEER